MQFTAAVARASAGAVLALQALGVAAAARSPDLGRLPNLIVERTDDFRKTQALAPTAVNAQLTHAAQTFAEYMARTDQHGHNVDGSSPAARAKRHGYNFCMVSENIAYQFDSAGFATDELARRFVEGWKNSPGHRKNMLEPDAMETGTAVARSSRTGRYYAVQMFGQPQAAMFEFQIANSSEIPVQYQFGGRRFELPARGTRTHQQCRPAQLVVHGNGEDARWSVQPANGDRFEIVRERLGLRLLKQ